VPPHLQKCLDNRLILAFFTGWETARQNKPQIKR
jgi:hypothetical protein